MKKYNSVVSLCFTVDHDDEEGKDITSEVVLKALYKRIDDCLSHSKDELRQACVSDLHDTQEND
jgi:hypothetical protein